MMGEKFRNKRFLMLGTSNSSVDIVKYVKSEGGYTIVADNLPPETSKAKLYADEHALVSTLDIDALEKLAVEKKIDAVFCGVSDRNLESVEKLTKRLSLPCYFDRIQYETFQIKNKFKEACASVGISVPKTYKAIENVHSYPVIVKPVDSFSGMGITICQDYASTKAAIKKAIETSPSQTAIIEDFIEGTEFTAYYAIVEGKASLMVLSERYLNDSQGGVSLLELNYYPSELTEKWLQSMDLKVRRLIENVNLITGTCFFQGRYNGEFVLFEGGCRIAGIAPQVILEKITGNNIMRLLVDYSFTGKAGNYDIGKDDPYLGEKSCATYVLMCGKGTISAFKGLEQMKDNPNIVYIDVKKHVGDTLKVTRTGHQRCILFYLIANDRKEIAETISVIQNRVDVIDENGNSMLLKPFDINRLTDR